MTATPYASDLTKNVNPMVRLTQSDTDRFEMNQAALPNMLSRYHGGHRRDNHPFIGGYFQVIFIPPARLFGEDDGIGRGVFERSQQWLMTTAESFTPHSRTLRKFDLNGMGGMNSSYVSGQDITRTFTITFREYQELPIMNIINTWTSIIDATTGTSPLAGDEYIPANYKGACYVALCKPTVGNRVEDGKGDLSAEDIEQLFYYDGVWPESYPIDSLSSDIATTDGLAVSIPFSFDGMPLTKEHKGVLDQFLVLASTNLIFDTYDHYQINIDSDTSEDSRSGGTETLGENNNTSSYI